MEASDNVLANAVITSSEGRDSSGGSRMWLKKPFEEGSREERQVVSFFHEVGIRGASPSDGNQRSTQPPCRLNPFAKEWNPFNERASEEDRCLFLTFSNGYPLTENQIITFFNNKYGPCVEKVYVHRPDPGNMNAPPLFGKVVFHVSYIPAIILMSGHKPTKFMVDGKPLWCKKFEAKKNKADGPWK